MRLEGRERQELFFFGKRMASWADEDMPEEAPVEAPPEPEPAPPAPKGGGGYVPPHMYAPPRPRRALRSWLTGSSASP